MRFIIQMEINAQTSNAQDVEKAVVKHVLESDIIDSVDDIEVTR